MDAWISLLNEECARDAALEASIVDGLATGELVICQRCGNVVDVDSALGDRCDCCCDGAAEVH